ncbi:MAG TPA: nucleotidyltransferase domain-containing protein [Rhizomicrobium sp.]|nr:nucleotidyltransferase domain-containing protein [Rhizomicrobium sp.]
MDRIITLSERKQAEAQRRQLAVASLKSELTAYAREHGGCFTLFGSAARQDMRYHSDVDILVDFSPDGDAAAWDFAEHACWDRGLEPDLMRRAWCKTSFLAHIAADSEALE